MALALSQYKDIFVHRNGLMDEVSFDQLSQLADKTKQPLDQLLMERSFITQPQMLQMLEDYFKVPATALRGEDIDIKAVTILPEDYAIKHNVIAFAKDDNGVSLAFENPADEQVMQELQNLISQPIKSFVSLRHSIQQALIFYKGDLRERLKQAAARLEQGSDTQAASEVMDLIVETALLLDASDIHIEPYETELIIRFRVDGQLRTVTSLPPAARVPLIARIKVIADLKVDQNRLPQDGRFSQTVEGQEINFRVSTVPSLWGEKIVLRILPKEAHLFDLNNIGLLDDDVKRIKEYLRRPHGMILVTGPTGSGKTTTLYAFLQEISSEKIDVVNISTIEDPIEYTIPRVTQIQTRPEIELTFASGLRALLRQDPDILMVGEIRDEETADFAVRAALVGRLLISSLHTNDAPATIPRLLDMGIEPYIVSSVLMLVVAQRLVRKLCTYCKQSYHPDASLVEELKAAHNLEQSLQRLNSIGVISESDPNNLRFYKSVGCDHCDHSGHKGRCGIYEILEMNPKLQETINRRADSTAIRQVAMENGLKTMFEDGLVKVMNGDIDIDELLRAAYS